MTSDLRPRSATNSLSAFSPTRTAFTLVELLVIIAIIGVLVALALPAIFAARESSRQAQCKNNIRQLALAIQLYQDSTGSFPINMGPWTGSSLDPITDPKNGLSGKGWITSILPQLDQAPLYEQLTPGFQGSFLLDEGLRTLPIRKALQTQLPVLQCPSDSSARRLSTEQWQWEGIPVAVTSYKGVLGDSKIGGDLSRHSGTMPDCHMFGNCNGLFFRTTFREPQSLRNVRDGTSNTLMVGEDLPEHNNHSAAFYSNGDYASCHAPLNYLPDPPRPNDWWDVLSFRSRHASGAHFALADGSVRFLSQQIDHALYRALSTKAGSEAARVP